MADKKLNAVSTASDGAYIYAEDSGGNQIKISKADLASVVAGLLPIPGYQSFYKTYAAGEQGVLSVSGQGLLFVYDNLSGHSVFIPVSSFKFTDVNFIKSSDSTGNLFSKELSESGKIGVNRTGTNESIVVSNNTGADRIIQGFFIKRKS